MARDILVARMATLSAGAVLDGRYRIVRPLDEGGMGTLFVAEHVFLHRRVALKVLRAELDGDAGAVARFEQEARAASAIDHPNIVRVTDFGRTSDGSVYLIMELLSGRALADELTAAGRLPPERAVAIAVEVLRGLEAAHGAGIVHRDLKPENVFLVEGGSIKLIDFGVAQVRSTADARLTSTGTVLGTPLYMAPEQVRGQNDLDARVDLHAIGVMLYEMLSGTTPYKGAHFGSIAHEILTGRPPPLVGVDEGLAALVMKAFTPDREQRFGSARALREALERWQPGELAAFAAARPSMLTDLSRPTGDFVQASEIANANANANANVNVNVNVNANVNANTRAKPTAGSTREVTFDKPVEAETVLDLDRSPPTVAAGLPPPRSRAPWRIAVAGLAVVLLGAGAWLALAHTRAPLSPAPSHYSVINLPSGGHLFLDGAEVGSSFDVDPVRAHRLRIEVRGRAVRLLQLDEHADPIIDAAR